VFVVFGATGKIGHATVRTLRAGGADVRAVVRDISRAGSLEDLGCEIVTADLGSPAQVALALRGAEGVQVIIPIVPQSRDVGTKMRATIGVIAGVLRSMPAPPSVVAISDYGAELDSGTGVTLAFHHLEIRLSDLPSPVTFVRSAEHMQNWARQIPAAMQTGTLASLHHPVTKLFPTVSAPDVGAVTAELLLAPPPRTSPRVLYLEGPKRYSALDVAAALSDLTNNEIVARELPRAEWVTALRRGGLSEGYAALVSELFDTHNRGGIEVEPNAEVRRGTTELHTAIASLLER
jgi:NAD(P)H dehydrogenase (quinone)